MMRHTKTQDRRTPLMIVITILLVSFFSFQPTDANAASCSCNGSVSVNFVGQIAAVAAGYDKTSFASACTSYGFSASDWSCSGSLTTDTGVLGTTCAEADANTVIDSMGLSTFSSFISASLSCTEVSESSSSSSVSGGGGGSGKICGSSTCTDDEVGPFMQDISQGCGNLGDCTLGDIIIVFVNIGNFVVGIIGAVVLLMYVAGGFFWLASAGRKEWVDKGKKYMTISTMGLLIVMFSYLGIYALKGALQYGTFKVSGEYVTCSGQDTDGDPCGDNAICTNEGYTCQTLCEIKNEAFEEDNSPGSETLQDWFWCVDTSDVSSSSNDDIDASTCQKDMCTGSQLCCQVSTFR